MVAQMVIRDANVLTMTEVPSAGDTLAIAIGEGRFLAVGTNAEIEPLIGEGTKVLTLPGRTVLPGFFDTHVHFAQTGRSALGPSACGAASSKEVLDLVAAIAAQAARDQVIMIYGCRLVELDERINRHDIDRVAPRNPVMIPDQGGHSAVVNTMGWSMLRIPPKTPGFPMDADTGWLHGSANLLARFQFYEHLEDSVTVAALHRAAEMAARVGITTVHAMDGGSADGHAWLPKRDVELLLQEERNLPVRTVIYFQSTDVQQAVDWGLPRIGGCLSVDGTYADHSAALLEPYTDDPATTGTLMFSDEELNNFVSRAHMAGLQICMHAIGDAAIEQLLNTYEQALQKAPRPDHRHRIDHFSLPTADHIERVARLGVALGMQPNWAATSEVMPDESVDWTKYLGAERCKRRHPYRKIIDAGILVGGGSDSDGKPMGPLLGMHAVVNHPDEERRLTVPEALSLYTTNGARMAFEEELKGTIEVGKLADLVVLGRNPMTSDPRTLRDIPVEMTIVGGEVINRCPSPAEDRETGISREGGAYEPS